VGTSKLIRSTASRGELHTLTYIRRYIKDFPNNVIVTVDNRCITDSSYIDFYFVGGMQGQQMFRVSIDFFQDSKCQQQDLLFEDFATDYHLQIVNTNSRKLFDKQLTFVRLMGELYNGNAFINIIRPNIANNDGDEFND